MGPNCTVIFRMLLHSPSLLLLFYLILLKGICLSFTLSKKKISPLSQILRFLLSSNELMFHHGARQILGHLVDPRAKRTSNKDEVFQFFDIPLSLCNSKLHKGIIPLALALSLAQSSGQYLLNICYAYTLSKNCFHRLSK